MMTSLTHKTKFTTWFVWDEYKHEQSPTNENTYI